MEKVLKNKKFYLMLSVMCVIALVATLASCTADNAPTTTGDDDDGSTTTTEVKTDVVAPDADDFEFGVITADAWEESYPEVYASYQANLSNAPGSEKHDYLELYPAITTLYAGFGFSKAYDEAASHLYSLDSIRATPRISDASLANCITCKTPQFTALVNQNGVEEYSKPFAETIQMMTEPISCYNCHENDPESLSTPHQYFVNGIGADASSVDMGSQVCGQCHNEYYFDPDTKATTLPYTGLSEMDPEKMLAYYDALGFKDWAYPGTDTPMLKVQHPEFETLYGGDSPAYMVTTVGYTCSDCHMGPATSDDGVDYISHEWNSPLENKELLENDCSSCHADLAKEVTDIQEASEKRVQEISVKLKEMAEKMVAGVADGSLAGDKLAELQTLHRSAQWYWDFVMVENSEGAHNPDFADKTLDKAEDLVDQALAML